MVNIIKQEITIEESLKKKLELICEFANTKPTIINGSIRKLERTLRIKYLLNNSKVLTFKSYKFIIVGIYLINILRGIKGISLTNVFDSSFFDIRS